MAQLATAPPARRLASRPAGPVAARAAHRRDGGALASAAGGGAGLSHRRAEVATFPFALWDRLARQASPGQRSAQAQYLDPAGDPDLRRAIALWLWASRGIHCDAAQVVVCSGLQQGIDLIARLLLDAGDEVLVEDPVTPSAPACWATARWRVPWHAGRAGPVLHPSRKALSARHAYCHGDVYRTSSPRAWACLAAALAALGATHDAWVVGDDFDGEFQYGGHGGTLATRARAVQPAGVGAGCCAWARSQDAAPRPAPGFTWWCRPLVDAFAMVPSPTGTHPAMRRRCWRASKSTKGHFAAASRRMRSCMWSASRHWVRRWRMRAMMRSCSPATGDAPAV